MSAGWRSEEIPNQLPSSLSSNNLDDHGRGHPIPDHAPSDSIADDHNNNHFLNTSSSNRPFNDADAYADDVDHAVGLGALAEDIIHNFNFNNNENTTPTNNDFKISSNSAIMTITTSRRGSGSGSSSGIGGGVSEIIEIMEESDEQALMLPSSLLLYSTPTTYFDDPYKCNLNRGQLTPIISESGMDTTSLFSIDINTYAVYVAVGEGQTSIDALLWTLNNAVHPSTSLVYLVHIFAELKFIPSPLGGGWVPKSQVSPRLAQSYVAQDRSKRRELLAKYMDQCNAHLVQVDTILIESESVANAILKLIPVLNIPKLVVGISKSNLRKLRGRKGSGIIADQIQQRAPVGCEVKIICQGKDVSDHGAQGYSTTSFASVTSSPSSKSSNSTAATPEAAATIIRRGAEEAEDDDDGQGQHQPHKFNSLSCCFKPNF